MKIAIDTSQIIYETGVSRYTKNLIEALIKIDRDNQYLIFGGSLRRYKDLKGMVEKFKGNAYTKIYPFPPSLADIVWNRLHLFPIEKLLGEIDVFHSSDWTQPPSKAFKVTTIHDVIPLKYPKLAVSGTVSVHERKFDLVKKEVDAIICPSETTKSDVVNLGADENKVFVVHEAPDPSFKLSRQVEISRIKRKYRIDAKYFLAIGITPRKNLDRIMQAFDNVKVGKNIKLVVVGEVKSEISYKRGVIFTGHVATDDLPSLYSGSEMLIYPSLYEGFGLPILEAFSCRVPVVTSNLGSMKEVADDAAVLVDPYNVDSIIKGIEKAFTERERLIKRGKERAGLFTWENVAKKTLSIYKLSKNDNTRNRN